MSVAAPKRQAKAPINFDIIMVCRKNQPATPAVNPARELNLPLAFKRAESQIARLRKDGWELSRNDIGVVVMAQTVAEISLQPEKIATEQAYAKIGAFITKAVDRITLVECYEPSR
jgi:putative DNA methylase